MAWLIPKHTSSDMDKARLEIRVGLFVAVGLVLVALLLVNFSKGVTRFAGTYELYLRTTDMGGIKRGAPVLMAGYPIGNVTDLSLSSRGESVRLTLQIKKEFFVRTNALFVIEQSGFLGDQFVAIYPGANLDVRFFQPGEEAVCPPPFNLQQTAREASGFIRRIDQTAKKLDGAIEDIRRLVLNEETLVQVSNTLSSLQAISQRAENAVVHVDDLVTTQTPLVSESVSNIAFFSRELRGFSEHLNVLLETQSGEITNTLKSIESAAELLNHLLVDLRAGKGVAGRLLADEQLAEDLGQIAHNLSITTSNLNQFGLWRMLWKRPTATPREPADGRLRAPKDPF
ncbi:MAG: MCE family protein [Verrucomicrobia bacterium]|nr:MCE family protein [Verrucomicrobiota bacterium]